MKKQNQTDRHHLSVGINQQKENSNFLNRCDDASCLGRLSRVAFRFGNSSPAINRSLKVFVETRSIPERKEIMDSHPVQTINET